MASDLNSILDSQIKQTFFQLIADLKNPNEVEVFLKDFLSDKELNIFAKRLATIYWLRKDRTTENIVTNLKVPENEVTKAKKELGSKGYKLAIKYLEAEDFANVWLEKIKKFKKK